MGVEENLKLVITDRHTQDVVPGPHPHKAGSI